MSKCKGFLHDFLVMLGKIDINYRNNNNEDWRLFKLPRIVCGHGVSFSVQFSSINYGIATHIVTMLGTCLFSIESVEIGYIESDGGGVDISAIEKYKIEESIFSHVPFKDLECFILKNGGIKSIDETNLGEKRADYSRERKMIEDLFLQRVKHLSL